MTSDERGAILGEKPTEPRSVFDYIPSGSKDQLDSVLKFMTHKRPVDPTKLTDFPKITKQQANMALRGFMPFGDNPKKQARYKSYLEDQAGVYGEPKDVLPVPEGLSHEEASKELDEFAKAARIFRPISAMMSGRFTSASADTSTVEQVSFQGGLKTEDQWRKEKEIKEKQEAEMQQPAKEVIPLRLDMGLLLLIIMCQIEINRSSSSCDEDVWTAYSYCEAILSCQIALQTFQCTQSTS